MGRRSVATSAGPVIGVLTMTVAKLARRSRLYAGVALVTIGVTAQLAGAQGSSTGASSMFRPPVLVIPPEIQQTEPQVEVTPDGTIFVGSQFQRKDCVTGEPRLFGSRSCIHRSDDGGKTFT